MSATRKKAHLERMYKAALEYLNDADLLRTSLNKSSDADYLLKLLAFEILLKAIAFAYDVRPKKNHSYRALFDSLPQDVQQRILTKAQERIGVRGGGPSLLDLFERFAYNFVGLRYSYEVYEGSTAEELRERENVWLTGGAKEEDATFTYYPEELFGLIFALGIELDNFQAL